MDAAAFLAALCSAAMPLAAAVMTVAAGTTAEPVPLVGFDDAAATTAVCLSVTLSVVAEALLTATAGTACGETGVAVLTAAAAAAAAEAAAAAAAASAAAAAAAIRTSSSRRSGCQAEWARVRMEARSNLGEQRVFMVFIMDGRVVCLVARFLL